MRLHSVVLPIENITELYRFALLLTGNDEAAADVLAGAVGEMPDELMQLRGEKNRTVWLLRKIRELASSPVSTSQNPESEMENEVSDLPSSSLPARIAALAEPERSALALFYLDLLELEEIAKLFKISVEELSERLGSARKHLQEAQA